MSALTTTLKAIRAESPCADGWQKLIEHLGKTSAEAKTDDTPLPVMTVLEANGIEDAIWVIDNCIDPHIFRLFAADCADRVLHLFEDIYPDDNRPRRAIEAARDPNISAAALAAARDDAKAAERDVERDVERDDAKAAERDAAWTAARVAERDAARTAAWFAAQATALAIARTAAWFAAQATARTAALAAARATAWDAAWDAARDAARTAARVAAWTAARAAQRNRLIQYIEHGEAAKDMPWAE